jgi:hypothetical protein
VLLLLVVVVVVLLLLLITRKGVLAGEAYHNWCGSGDGGKQPHHRHVHRLVEV